MLRLSERGLLNSARKQSGCWMRNLLMPWYGRQRMHAIADPLNDATGALTMAVRLLKGMTMDAVLLRK